MVTKAAALARCADVPTLAAVNFVRTARWPIADPRRRPQRAGFRHVRRGPSSSPCMMKGVRVDPVKPHRAGGVSFARRAMLTIATHSLRLSIPAAASRPQAFCRLTLSGGPGDLTANTTRHRYSYRGRCGSGDGTFLWRTKRQPHLLCGTARAPEGNFGVVTRFLFEAAPAITGLGRGPIFWELKYAARIRRWYRYFQASAPDGVLPFLGLQRFPSSDPLPKDIGTNDWRAPHPRHTGTAS